MTFYKKHAFFCINQRDENKKCCNQSSAKEMLDYAKAKIKALNLNGKHKIRINAAGCLDRCREGPVIVIYPEAVWYTYQSIADIDEIISEHLIHSRIVNRLLLPV